MPHEVLLITPPFTQLNTPYPATAYLKGFLNTKAISSYQVDLGIEVINRLFSKEQIEQLFLSIKPDDIESDRAWSVFQNRQRYIHNVDSVIMFLQGKDSGMARILASEHFLPRGHRLAAAQDEDAWAFGTMGFQDKAKHYCTLFLEDLGDFIADVIDNDFGFSRYAERLGRSANSFDELHDALQAPLSCIDKLTIAILEQKLSNSQPLLVCLTVPFPGNLFSALRCGQYIKQQYPQVRVALGGGFANTELRSVTDARVFQYLDFITLDDGELPVELVYDFVKSQKSPNNAILKRTFLMDRGEVYHNNLSLQKDYSQLEVGTPDYSDLLLDQYISVIEVANPMHSLWSDGRWNKLTMAHGCYWGKCTVCDISLDYISKYEPVTANVLVDRMEAMILQTGQRGFHFVDEAAPPSLMKAVALEILRRKLVVSWWTNIRFEKSFTSCLCELLAASGCIAVSGGHEVASDRLLDVIKKGVTVSQVAQVTNNFTQAGIMVHAYLMYGYPTQTVQETIDSLEMVRQLFQAGVIQSGFWHQFALTAHSPIGQDPSAYGLKAKKAMISFADNDVDFDDATGIDHSVFSEGLKISLYNFMNGVGFDLPLQEWFEESIPETTVHPEYIMDCLYTNDVNIYKDHYQLIYLGQEPIIEIEGDYCLLTLIGRTQTTEVELDAEFGEWLYDWLQRLTPYSGEKHTWLDFKKSYESVFEGFEEFLEEEWVAALREHELIQV